MRVAYHRMAVAAVATACLGLVDATKFASWMADSIMSRGQGIMTGKGGSSELLQAGFTQKAFAAFAAQYPHDDLTPKIEAYIKQSAASVVPFISNATFDSQSYPLDRLSNGNALLRLSSQGPQGLVGGQSTVALRGAADALHESIDLNRRSSQGGLWYFVYPNWSYLDGMYSLAPFYAEYTTNVTNRRESLQDLQYQLDLLWQRTRNPSSGLLVHGYDDSRTAVWADKNTGASGYVWDRSLGWFIMALVDTLEILSGSVYQYGDLSKYLLEKYQALAPAVIKAVDRKTGAWWQVMDQPGRDGNYIESSGSAMFAYALLKGKRLGYLKGKTAQEAAIIGTRAQAYLSRRFLVREKNGTLSYDGTVSVCSLNSTASFEYYIKQPILYNSVLGSAAYVLASLEVERQQW